MNAFRVLSILALGALLCCIGVTAPPYSYGQANNIGQSSAPPIIGPSTASPYYGATQVAPVPPEPNSAFGPRYVMMWDRDPQVTQFMQQYANSTKEEEKKEIRKKLGEALSKQFDQHAQQQQKELEDLEKQVATLRTVLKKRMDAKSAIVERRTEQLLLDAEGLGWSTPSGQFKPSTVTPRAVQPAYGR